EISPHSSKLQYRMIASEGLFNMANMFFDNAYNTLQMKVKAYNTEIQICKNIEKLKEAQGWKIASIGLQVVAVALAIVASVLTFGALALPATIAVVSLCSALAGLGAAGMQSMGSYVASQVDDSYDVNNPNFRVSDNINLTPHKKPSEVIDDAEQVENEIINQMGGAGLLERNQDGFYTLNSRALAAFEIRQQSLHNMVKMIAFLKKAQRDLNRAIMGIVLEKAMKDHGEGYLLSNIENSLHQRQLVMQSIKFQLQEQVTGRNIARQNEIMASKAIWSSAAGVIGALGCAALAAIPGAGGLSVVPAFMSIGAAVGSSLYNYIESRSESSGYGMKYESHSKEFEQLMAERKKTATEAKIAEDKLYQMENAAFEELLANGEVGTGDGYTGVNYTAVGKAYQQILNIQNIRQYLMELRNAQIRLSASTRRQVLGISTSETTDLSGIVAQRGLSQAMAIIAAVTRMFADKAAVQNRARDAQKQARMATFSLVANVSIAGVGMGMGYSPNALGIGKTAADVSRNVTPGLMGLVNATGSLIMNALWARDDFGSYNNYDSDKAVKEIRGNRRQKTEQDTFDKLAALEDQVFQEMGENIVQSMDAGVGSVNGEITGILNTRMHAINNLRKSLLILMSARDQFSQAIRRKVGVGGGPIADANDLASPQERIAQQILNSLTQGVQTLLERQNQISQYERQQFIGSVSVVLSAASVALGAIAAVKGSEAEEKMETINGQAKVPEARPLPPPDANAPTQPGTAPTQPATTPSPPTQPATPPPAQPAHPTNTTGNAPAVNATVTTSAPPPAGPAQPGQGQTGTPGAVAPNAPSQGAQPVGGNAQVPGTPPSPSRNPDGIDPGQKQFHKNELLREYNNLSDSARHFQLASGSVALVNTFWNFYGGVLVFDPAQEEKKSNVSNSKLDVVRDGQTAKKSSALQTSSSSSSDSGGIYGATGANEADALQSEVMISSYSSPTAANIALQRADQMVTTWQSGIQQGVGTAAYLRSSKDDGKVVSEIQRGEAIPGELAEGSRINLNSGTIEQTYSIVKDHSDPVAFVKTEVDQGRLSRDRATALLNRLEADRPELKPQIDQVRASLAAAVSQPAPAQPGRPATPYQQDTSSTASRSRALIAHADELLSQQQTRATNTSTQVTAVQVDVRNISTQLVDVDTQVKAVQAKIPNATGSEHTSLTQQLSALKQRRDQLVTLFNDKVREVNRLETQIRALRTTSTTEIDHEIAALEQLKRDVNIPPQEVRDIDAKINMLRQARPQREREIQQAEQRLAQVKQEIGQIKRQLTQINQHIAQVQRELEKEKEKTSKRELDADDKKSSSATAGVRGSVVRAVGNLGNGRGNGGNGQGNGYKDKADHLQEEQDLVLASTNHGSTIGGVS
ncbi:MAG: hypothetical protein KKF06_01440, partial [Candidatus Margulisbacteria bacterium]|nr:hypothetical protein [Candidatus Margulisiibacteriota bacterium]